MNEMLDDVIAAFDRQDYATAARLLKALLKQAPQDPWVQLYVARLQEVAGKLTEAEAIYRQLLQSTTSAKLAGQARQGIQRIINTQRQQRQQALAQATAAPDSHTLGFLALESVTGEPRSQAIQALAQVMKLDSYTARLLVPSRGWRLYRAGPIGELQLYGQELQAAGAPAVWASLTALQKIQVFRVCYFKTIAPQVTVVCQSEQGQLGSLTFEWSEVSQRVEGLLPIFEQVLELGYRDRLERKEKTQDYAHFCDLHLPGRGCLLRIQDSRYQFDRGVLMVPPHPTADLLDRTTLRTNWNNLLSQLTQARSTLPIWSEFMAFAETSGDFEAPLGRLQPHIDLMRHTPTFWDAAFHLYSGLVFLRNG